MNCGWKWREQRLTKDCQSKNHVIHDFVAHTATGILRRVHFGLQVALGHPYLHLLLHFVGTERNKEGRIDVIYYVLFLLTFKTRC